jgi:hypothetical protein
LVALPLVVIAGCDKFKRGDAAVEAGAPAASDTAAQPATRAAGQDHDDQPLSPVNTGNPNVAPQPGVAPLRDAAAVAPDANGARDAAPSKDAALPTLDAALPTLDAGIKLPDASVAPIPTPKPNTTLPPTPTLRIPTALPTAFPTALPTFPR